MDEALYADKATTMATDESSNFDFLAEIVRLEREEAELSARRRKLLERMDCAVPSETLIDLERTVSEKRHALHRRIAELHAQLASGIRRPA